MDSIWQRAFGVDADSQNNINDPYFEKCENQFKEFQGTEIFSHLSFNLSLFNEFCFKYKNYILSLIS